MRYSLRLQATGVHSGLTILPVASILIRSIAPLLVAAAILLAGNGLLGTLIALSAKAQGFDTSLIGLMGTSYFAGFFAACYYASRLVRAFGHVRVFAALAAVGAIVPLLIAILPNPFVWIAVRAVGGFCFAALLMVVESWINEVAKNADRGRILSVYRIVDLLAVTSAQFIIPLLGGTGYVIFSVVAIMFCLSLLPISLSNRSKPQPLQKMQLSLRDVWEISPLACLTSLSIGLTNSAFRLVGPVYAIEIGLDTRSVVVFMSMGIAGGALLQYPLGSLSDRFGRRKILLMATFGAMLSGLFLSYQDKGTVLGLYAGALMFGAFALPLYSLAAAHANDRAQDGQYILISAGLTFYFSIGAVIGPYAASLVISRFEPHAFFLYTCAVHGTLALFVMLRMRLRTSVPAEYRSRFVTLLQTSPGFFRLARKLGRPRRRD